jgi:hypothetical protein
MWACEYVSMSVCERVCMSIDVCLSASLPACLPVCRYDIILCIYITLNSLISIRMDAYEISSMCTRHAHILMMVQLMQVLCCV